MRDHYTHEHRVTVVSSVDIIECCAAVIRQMFDFEGITYYADNDGELEKYREMIHKLSKLAMQIIAKECA